MIFSSTGKNVPESLQKLPSPSKNGLVDYAVLGIGINVLPPERVFLTK